MQSIGIDPVDIHKNEAVRIALEWVQSVHPDATTASFRISWFAYIHNGWKCMLAFKPIPGTFYEVTKNMRTGEICGCQYNQTAYFVKPSKQEALVFSGRRFYEELDLA